MSSLHRHCPAGCTGVVGMTDSIQPAGSSRAMLDQAVLPSDKLRSSREPARLRAAGLLAVCRCSFAGELEDALSGAT